MSNLVIGKKAVLDIITQEKIEKVILSNKDQKLIQQLAIHNISYEINNNKGWYDFITNKANHQTVIAYLKETKNKIDLSSFLDKVNSENECKVVVLDSIEDPQNFGSIIRTCAFFGVDAIIYKKNNQCPVNTTVLKVSMGGTNHIHMIEVVNLNECIKKLKDSKFWIYASAIRDDCQNANSISFDKRSVLVVGNENKGISKLVLDNADFKITITGRQFVQSLNVACATSILVNNMMKK